MKVLASWLRDFVPDLAGDPVELGERMSALGLAVEDIEHIGEGVAGVVVAEVLALRPHPDADRIQIVDVDAGDGEALQVCCGAFNMAVGDRIPFAPIGVTMPNGMEIARRKMRGEWSNGMCCSGAELGLGDDHDGIMILAPDAPVGVALNEALGLEPDVVWDLEVNANRPDALSIVGVARDLAAGLGLPFVDPDPPPLGPGHADPAPVGVDLLDPTLCGRFLATAFDGVSVGPSPSWLANRLRALGQRPISNVVDISNYVMLELGQPNHTYDRALVPGGRLRVRRAVEGEQLITLDGVTRTLTAIDGVIADRDDTPIGLAGIMGGEATEISESTDAVLLEIAWWDPPSISRTVKRLQLRSDASARYQRGADWGENMHTALRRFSELLTATGARRVGEVIEEHGDLPDRTPIEVRPQRVNGLLGTDLTGDQMARHLRSIGFAVDGGGADDTTPLDVTVPTWRWDTEAEVDVIEEIARLHGYENLVRTVPKGDAAGGLNEHQQARRLVRQVLVGAGCDETQPLPFVAPGDLRRCGLPDDGITLTNPLVAEESVLRTSLLPGQLEIVAFNQSHRNANVRLFEIGHVFLPPPDGQLLPDEREMMAVVLAGSDAPAAVAVLDVLAEALALPNLQIRNAEIPGLHPTRAAEVWVAGRRRGSVGEVDPAVIADFGVEGRVGWLELDLGEVLAGPHGNKRYHPVSKYPSSDIDLAFVVDDAIAASAIEASIRKSAGDLLVDLSLFDVFRDGSLGDGNRSLAYRLRLQAPDRTLTDGEVAELRQRCIDDVSSAHGARLRG